VCTVVVRCTDCVMSAVQLREAHRVVVGCNADCAIVRAILHVVVKVTVVLVTL
jgi:hypothetical protein